MKWKNELKNCQTDQGIGSEQAGSYREYLLLGTISEELMKIMPLAHLKTSTSSTRLAYERVRWNCALRI